MAVRDTYFAPEIAGERSWLKDVALVLGASIMIGLFAPIAIQLPFTPVRLAVQAHVVLLLSCFLGSKRAPMAVLAFLCQGAMGLPFFAGGKAGMMILAGPSGGYLLGYLAAAFVTGFLMERMTNRTPTKAFAVMGLGNLVVYLFGLPWLSRFVGWEGAFLLGMLPFLIGDLLKLIVATKLLKSLRFLK